MTWFWNFLAGTPKNYWRIYYYILNLMFLLKFRYVIKKILDQYQPFSIYIGHIYTNCGKMKLHLTSQVLFMIHQNFIILLGDYFILSHLAPTLLTYVTGFILFHFIPLNFISMLFHFLYNKNFALAERPGFDCMSYFSFTCHWLFF